MVDAQGKVLNLRRYALSAQSRRGLRKKPVIAVLGTSMNPGKTTAAALVRGLSAAGYRVAAVKATGTGSGNDVWSYADAGAALTLDFTDAGYPSTYRIPSLEIQACFERLRQAGIKPLALSGLLTASSLAASEAQAYSGVPVLTKAELEAPSIAKRIRYETI